MASVRDYAILFPSKRKMLGASGGYARGGNVVLDAPKHALDGAEHTGNLPIERISTDELDTTLLVAPDGTGGLTFVDPANSVWHPVMAQDPAGAEPDRWWVVTDGSGTAVMAEG